MAGEIDEGRWADWRSTAALTGIGRSDLAWAASVGDVRYDLRRPGHEGTLMLCVDDVEALLRRTAASHLRLVDDGG